LRSGGTTHADETDDDCDEGNCNSSKATRCLRYELDGLNGVGLGDGEEEVKLLSDVVDRVVKEDKVAW
jgi:hypothetical protein